MNTVRAAFLALFALALASTAWTAEESQKYQNFLTPLLKSGETIIGQKFSYPADGAADVTGAIVVIPPGGETGWHTHQVPLFVYILEGEVTVDYGSKGVKVYKAGDSLMEAMDWAHNGTNKSTAPVRIMAVYMGADGKSNAAPASSPQ